MGVGEAGREMKRCKKSPEDLSATAVVWANLSGNNIRCIIGLSKGTKVLG